MKLKVKKKSCFLHPLCKVMGNDKNKIIIVSNDNQKSYKIRFSSILIIIIIIISFSFNKIILSLFSYSLLPLLLLKTNCSALCKDKHPS